MKVNFYATAAMAAGAILASAATAQAATNIVLNPDFDANSPAPGAAPVDWTLTPALSGTDFFVGPGPTLGAFSPLNSANFGAVGATNDVLSQTLTTTPGDLYTISFELAHTASSATNNFDASFGSTPILVETGATNFGYTLETFMVTATSASTDLTFAGRDTQAWYLLDNVSVTSASATPEPASWAMMVLGLGMIGSGLRLARHKSGALQAT